MDIDKILNEMSVKEKVVLVTGASAWSTASVKRLNIPKIIMTDGPHGVRRVENTNEEINVLSLNKSLPSTCFPTASALSSSWNPELLYKMGKAIAIECIDQGVNVILGPGNNIKRTPLCGRNFEYFSEDPILSSNLAIAMIKGIQSMGVGATLKHFVANNQEYKRQLISADIGERALREIYLYGFERVVKEAKPWLVMCAYNKVNGTFCSENYRLLTSILRDEWGYEGVVVSDWGAVHDRVTTLNAGLDLEMPGPSKKSYKEVLKAVKVGDISHEVLDESVKRILSLINKTIKNVKDTSFNVEKHHRLARDIAEESIVLLKNEDNMLPLTKAKKVAVIGKIAMEPKIQGGGSSEVNPTRLDIPFEEIRTLADNDEDILYSEGYSLDCVVDQERIDHAKSIARSSDVAIIFIGLPSYIEYESYDRENMYLPEQQLRLIEEVSSITETIVVLNTGSPVIIDDWESKPKAIIQGWLGGQGSGNAIAKIVYGDVNPSGKLAETFPTSLESTPAYLNYPEEDDYISYGEGVFVGYRYYDKKKLDVSYPFGFGLSYSSFKYENLKISNTDIKDIDGITVELDVTNISELPGSDVVQLYVRDKESRYNRPDRELKAFKKVHLKPSETKHVKLELGYRDFCFYDCIENAFKSESGAFDILVGNSSRDIYLMDSVNVTSTYSEVCKLDYDSTVRDWMNDKRGREVIDNLIKEVTSSEEYKRENENTGIDIIKASLDTKLSFVLKQLQWSFPFVPDVIMYKLLSQVHKK
jgi:beta-glucosidase